MHQSQVDLKSNSSLHRSLNMLAHPRTWLALALLLINDHLLRVVWPSWLTGKLGDFAWLFFTPLVLAALFSLLVPARWANQARVVALLSFGGTALVFGLAKTLPAALALTVQLASALFQSPVSLRLDPSDLIALIALLPAFLLWQRRPEGAPGCAARGWLALPLAALLTMANSPAPPNFGVYCLVPNSQQPVALARYAEGYSSPDGGLSWQPVSWNELGFWPSCSSDRYDIVTCTLMKGQPRTCGNNCTPVFEGNEGVCSFPPAGTQQTLRSPLDPAVIFQYQTGDAIKVSNDGGLTWTKEFSRTTNEAQRDYLAATLNRYSASGPLDGLVDPQSGNAIFAMGFEGVLVYQVEAQAWRWVALAGNTHKDLDPLTLMQKLISDEFFLGVVLGLLSVVSLALTFQRSGARIAFLVIAWIVWGIAVVFLRLPYGYDPTGLNGLVTFALVYACIILSGLIGLVLVVKPAEKMGWFGVKVFFASFLLFFMPYLLWTLGSLLYYDTARLFALILVGVYLRVEWRMRWRRGE